MVGIWTGAPQRRPRRSVSRASAAREAAGRGAEEALESTSEVRLVDESDVHRHVGQWLTVQDAVAGDALSRLIAGERAHWVVSVALAVALAATVVVVWI
jgi:hypothetical protein